MSRYPVKVIAGTGGGYIKSFLREYMPAFCWMTSEELLYMTEVLFPDIEEHVFRVSLTQMHRNGEIVSKPYDRPTQLKQNRGRKLLYRRAE